MNINFIPAWDQGVLKPLEKLEVHKRGLRHKAVSVFLISDNNVLIQKRASMKYHTPGLWANTCCTHPLWSEDPKECAHRRLKEELGIEVPELVYKNKIDYKADVGNGLIENENVDVFVGSIKEKDNLNINCPKSKKECLSRKYLNKCGWCYFKNINNITTGKCMPGNKNGPLDINKKKNVI